MSSDAESAGLLQSYYSQRPLIHLLRGEPTEFLTAYYNRLWWSTITSFSRPCANFPKRGKKMRKSIAGLTSLFFLLAISATMRAAPLKVGDKAPNFALPNQNGDTIKLSDFLGKRTVVLFFFAASCSDDSTSVIKPYQERFAQFKQANVEVVGITVENVYAVEAFATELQTPFPLLSDYGIHFDKEVSRAYGAIEGDARFASRFTIVIDKNGIIRHVEKDADPDQILKISRGL